MTLNSNVLHQTPMKLKSELKAVEVPVRIIKYVINNITFTENKKNPI